MKTHVLLHFEHRNEYCKVSTQKLYSNYISIDSKILPTCGDRSRSLGSLVNSSAIVTITWKQNFHFASDRQRSQRLPTIATFTIAGIESESISAIVSDCNELMETISAAIAAIVTIPAIIWKSEHSDRNDRDDRSDHMRPAIVTIPAIIWKSEHSDRNDRDDRSDHMRPAI